MYIPPAMKARFAAMEIKARAQREELRAMTVKAAGEAMAAALFDDLDDESEEGEVRRRAAVDKALADLHRARMEHGECDDQQPGEPHPESPGEPCDDAR